MFCSTELSRCQPGSSPKPRLSIWHLFLCRLYYLVHPWCARGWTHFHEHPCNVLVSKTISLEKMLALWSLWWILVRHRVKHMVISESFVCDVGLNFLYKVFIMFYNTWLAVHGSSITCFNCTEPRVSITCVSDLLQILTVLFNHKLRQSLPSTLTSDSSWTGGSVHVWLWCWGNRKNN